jgi:quercetin dioxygenase-like cupin family protein
VGPDGKSIAFLPGTGQGKVCACEHLWRRKRGKEMEDVPKPRVIRLGDGAVRYQPVLEGPPDSIALHSGVVTLAPEKSVGMHSTKGWEELITVLEGQGELQIAGHDPLPIEPGVAAYCPPQSDHDVVNTGSSTLRYLFVVTQVMD